MARVMGRDPFRQLYSHLQTYRVTPHPATREATVEMLSGRKVQDKATGCKEEYSKRQRGHSEGKGET